MFPPLDICKSEPFKWAASKQRDIACSYLSTCVRTDTKATALLAKTRQHTTQANVARGSRSFGGVVRLHLVSDRQHTAARVGRWWLLWSYIHRPRRKVSLHSAASYLDWERDLHQVCLGTTACVVCSGRRAATRRLLLLRSLQALCVRACSHADVAVPLCCRVSKLYVKDACVSDRDNELGLDTVKHVTCSSVEDIDSTTCNTVFSSGKPGNLLKLPQKQES